MNTTGTAEPWRWWTVYNNATAALWGNTDSSQEWDAKAWDTTFGWYRIWFVGHGSNPCQSLSSQEHGPIEIEYWVEDDTRCCQPAQPYLCNDPRVDASCAFADTPVLYEAGHWNFGFYYIFLYKPYAVGDVSGDGGANFAYHQINHETGHAIGFADGGGALDCPTPASVMHSRAYQCSENVRYPSTGDTSAETTYAMSH